MTSYIMNIVTEEFLRSEWRGGSFSVKSFSTTEDAEDTEEVVSTAEKMDGHRKIPPGSAGAEPLGMTWG